MQPLFPQNPLITHSGGMSHRCNMLIHRPVWLTSTHLLYTKEWATTQHHIPQVSHTHTPNSCAEWISQILHLIKFIKLTFWKTCTLQKTNCDVHVCLYMYMYMHSSQLHVHACMSPCKTQTITGSLYTCACVFLHVYSATMSWPRIQSLDYDINFTGSDTIIQIWTRGLEWFDWPTAGCAVHRDGGGYTRYDIQVLGYARHRSGCVCVDMPSRSHEGGCIRLPQALAQHTLYASIIGPGAC